MHSSFTKGSSQRLLTRSGLLPRGLALVLFTTMTSLPRCRALQGGCSLKVGVGRDPLVYVNYLGLSFVQSKHCL